jgi:hypothetical protein
VGANSVDARCKLRRMSVLAAAAAGIALLAAACGGGGGGPSSAQSPKYQKALRFVQCMRTHGVPTFPDPTSNGAISDSQASVNSPQVLSAFANCRAMLPAGALVLTEAQQEALLNKALKRAECMRAHGITNFPDPSLHGGAVHVGPKASGIDPNSPLFQAAAKACALRSSGT